VLISYKLIGFSTLYWIGDIFSEFHEAGLSAKAAVCAKS
jgi:hypothetical protein